MSVIENTLKRLQGQRPASGSPAVEADGKGYGTVTAAGAARRREARGDAITPEGAVVLDQDALRAAGMRSEERRVGKEC